MAAQKVYFCLTPSTANTGAKVTAKTRKDYVASFAEAVTRFGGGNSSGSVLTHIPEVLVSNFDVARSELWLWDESSASVYLTHFAGAEGGHRRDFAASGDGAIGAAAHAREARENVELAN